MEHIAVIIGALNGAHTREFFSAGFGAPPTALERAAAWREAGYTARTYLVHVDLVTGEVLSHPLD
jgi:hypothetical protein